MMEISLILDCILRRWMDYGTAEWCILLLRNYGMFTCLLRLLFIILKQEEKREFGDYWRGRAFNTVVSILYPLLPTQIHFLFILLMEKRRQATKFSLLSLSTLPWKMANDDLFSNGENAPFSIKYQKTSLNISSCPLFSPWKIKLSLLPCLVRFEKVKGDLQRWQLRNRTTKKSKTWQTYLVKHDFSPTAQLIFIVHSKSWEFFVGMFFFIFPASILVAIRITTKFGCVLVFTSIFFLLWRFTECRVQWYWKSTLSIHWDFFYMIHNARGNDFMTVRC